MPSTLKGGKRQRANRNTRRNPVLEGGYKVNAGADTCIFSPVVSCANNTKHLPYQQMRGQYISRLVKGSGRSWDAYIEEYIRTRYPNFKYQKIVSVCELDCKPDFRAEDLTGITSKACADFDQSLRGAQNDYDNLITSNFDGGSYYDYVNNEQDGNVALDLLRGALNAAVGLVPDNGPWIIHADCHLGNVLVSSVGQSKRSALADWGRSILIENPNDPANVLSGLSAYLARFSDTFTFADFRDWVYNGGDKLTQHPSALLGTLDGYYRSLETYVNQGSTISNLSQKLPALRGFTTYSIFNSFKDKYAPRIDISSLLESTSQQDLQDRVNRLVNIQGFVDLRLIPAVAGRAAAVPSEAVIAPLPRESFSASQFITVIPKKDRTLPIRLPPPVSVRELYLEKMRAAAETAAAAEEAEIQRRLQGMARPGIVIKNQPYTHWQAKAKRQQLEEDRFARQRNREIEQKYTARDEEIDKIFGKEVKENPDIPKDVRERAKREVENLISKAKTKASIYLEGKERYNYDLDKDIYKERKPKDIDPRIWIVARDLLYKERKKEKQNKEDRARKGMIQEKLYQEATIKNFFKAIEEDDIKTVRKILRRVYSSDLDLNEEYEVDGLKVGPSLVWAIKFNRPSIAGILLNYNADMYQKRDFIIGNSKKTMTIYDYVKSIPYTYLELKKVFIEERERQIDKYIGFLDRGINVSKRTGFNKDIVEGAQKREDFFEAIKDRNRYIIDTYINEGFDTNRRYLLKGFEGIPLSPLEYAVENNEWLIADILLESGADPCELIPDDDGGANGDQEITIQEYVSTLDGPEYIKLKGVFEKYDRSCIPKPEPTGLQFYNWHNEGFQKRQRETTVITGFFSDIKNGEIDDVKRALGQRYQEPVIDLDNQYDVYGSILGPSLVWAIKYNQPAIAKLLIQNGANMFQVFNFGGEKNGNKTMAIYDYVKSLPLKEEYMGLKRAFESEMEAKVSNAIDKLKKKSIMLKPLERQVRDEALKRINLEEKTKQNEVALRAAQAAEAAEAEQQKKAKLFYKAIQESDQSTIQHSINTEYIRINEKYIVEGYPQGVSPLTYAIHINNPKSAEILLRLGADPCEVISVDFEGNIGVRQITLHDLVKTFGPDRRGVKEVFSQVEPCNSKTFTVTARNASASNDMIIGNAPNAPVIAANATANGAVSGAANATAATPATPTNQADADAGFFSSDGGLLSRVISLFRGGRRRTRKHKNKKSKKTKQSKRHSRR